MHHLSHPLRSGGWLFYESTHPRRPPRRPGDSRPRDVQHHMQVRLCCSARESSRAKTNLFASVEPMMILLLKRAFPPATEVPPPHRPQTLSQCLLGWTPAHPSTWLRTNNANQNATVKKLRKVERINRCGLDMHQPCQVQLANLTHDSLNAPKSVNQRNIWVFILLRLWSFNRLSCSAKTPASTH